MCRPRPPARTRLAVLVCLLLVTLAGCSFGAIDGSSSPTPATETATPTPPTPTWSTTPTGTTPTESTPGLPAIRDRRPTPVAVDAPTMTVTGGDPPVDAGRVWALTMRVLEADPTARPTVAIEGAMPRPVADPPAFARLLGLDRGESGVEAAGYVRDEETVHMNERILDRPVLFEYTLAHEYVHVLQFQWGVFDSMDERYGESPDDRATSRGITEGTAVYAADVYWQRHVARGPSPSGDIERIRRNTTGYTWYATAPYYFGYEYAAARLDSPADLRRVYDDPPRTTEELLHRLPPGSEPPARLQVRIEDGGDGENGGDGRGDGSEWRERDAARHRMGELYVRAVLRTELDGERAARGADGWGEDARLLFAHEDRDDRGYAWVLRWDDRANATEFVEAFRAYLDRRATRENDTWRNGSAAYRVERLDARSTVVYAGAQAFVGNATADAAGNGTVTVRPPQRVAAGPAAQSVTTSGMAKVTTSPARSIAKPTATSLNE